MGDGCGVWDVGSKNGQHFLKLEVRNQKLEEQRHLKQTSPTCPPNHLSTLKNSLTSQSLMSHVFCRKPEDGRWKMEDGGWKPEAGTWGFDNSG